MKFNKLISITLLLLLTLGAVTSLDSCKFKNPIEGVKLIINYDLIKTFINVEFVDATTGEMIGQDDDTKVKVIITGPDADAVLDNTGIAKDEFYSTKGFMALALNPNSEFVPTAENPIRFTVVATLDGYISTSKTITLGQEGTFNERIVMTDISNPPSGVVVKEEKGIGDLQDGVVQEEISVRTQNDEAYLIIPGGTVIKDGNGNTLTGSLDITLVYFSNLEDASLAAFPGGLMTRVKQDGQTIDGAFFSAGFMAIEVNDQNGTKAEIFEENTAELGMGIDGQTYNPETSSQIGTGNELPLYSYDPETGEWTQEQIVTVESGDRSDFQVTAQISHLSYWNFDWFWSEWCYEGLRIEFIGDFGECGCTQQLGIMRKQVDNSFFSYVYFMACEGEYIQTYYAPANMPVYIEWINQSCSRIVVEEDYTYIENLCAPDLLLINIIAFQANTTTVTVDVMGRCASNPEVEIRPTYGAWYRPLNDYCWRWAEMHNGYTEICDVVIGQEYVIGTYFNGQWYEHVELVTQDSYVFWEIDLPEEFCNEIF